MMKNSIIKAINKGINKGLIQFDNDDHILFSKSKNSGNLSKYLQDYKLGDYVYLDSKLGYNNSIGKKVAVCVNDDVDNLLFAVIRHPLLRKKLVWANEGSNLYNDEVLNFDSGYENTKYILEKYSNELKGTIWDQLQTNEYIPTKDELKIIYKNCENNRLIWKKVGLSEQIYWSSSLYPNRLYSFYAITFIFVEGFLDDYNKTSKYNSVVLLHID